MITIILITILIVSKTNNAGSQSEIRASRGVKLKRPESDGDAKVLKPTVMVFAPAVLDKVLPKP